MIEKKIMLTLSLTFKIVNLVSMSFIYLKVLFEYSFILKLSNKIDLILKSFSALG
jgi:hypothetical protein